jgi:hypothetical protein
MIWIYYHLKRWNTNFSRNQDTFKNSYLLKMIFLKFMYLDNYKHLL